jgi:hypothetical protein
VNILGSHDVAEHFAVANDGGRSVITRRFDGQYRYTHILPDFVLACRVLINKKTAPGY